MRSMMTRGLALTAAFCIFFLIGCATTLMTIPQDYTLGAKDESVVIGRLVVDLDIPPLAFFANLGRMGLTVRNEATEKDYGLVCDRTGLDSEFYVSLPPGRYRFVRVNAMNAVSQLPPARFEVGAGQVLYLGTIRYRGQSLLGPGRWLVDDESEKTVKSFRERYPRITQPVVKSAMIEGAQPVPPPSFTRPDVAASERLYTNDEIYEATQAGDLAKAKALLVKELLDQNPKLANVKIEEGWTPLHLAASVGRKDIVDLLLAKGGDANARDNAGMTPLAAAATFGHKNVAEFLLTKGAEVNARDKVYGLTVLHYVVSIGRKDMADLLLANKADINPKAKNGATPLHSAALHGRKDMVELLLAKGADVNARDNIGMTPLSMASMGGFTEVITVLRRHGAKE